MRTGFSAVGALTACTFMFALGTGFAEAAERSSRAKPPVAKEPAVTAYSSANSPATADPPATGAVAAPETEDANCTRQRKRLWV